MGTWGGGIWRTGAFHSSEAPQATMRRLTERGPGTTPALEWSFQTHRVPQGIGSGHEHSVSAFCGDSP